MNENRQEIYNPKQKYLERVIHLLADFFVYHILKSIAAVRNSCTASTINFKGIY